MTDQKSLAEIVCETIRRMETEKKIAPNLLGFYRDEAGWLRPINPQGY